MKREEQKMNLQLTVREMAARLSLCGIEAAEFEALLLAEKFTRRSAASLRASMDEPLFPDLTDTEQAKAASELSEALRRRCERYPLQYILGEWEFMGLPFAVDEHCLIPRSDTEILCEYILEHGAKGGRMLDLCTGSGCILASVLHYRPDMTGTAVELYPDTMRCAEKNFAALSLKDRVSTIEGDATVDLFPKGERFDVISANPPYISTEEMASLAPELGAEPAHALTDGGDGLSILRAIIRIYASHLADGGFMILEHGVSQGEAVASYAHTLGYAVQALRDYGGNVRAAVIVK